MKKSIVFGILFIVLTTCAGCTVLGKTKEYQPFDPQGLKEVIPGKSTARDITRLFGAPVEVVKLTNGNAYFYKRAVTKGTALWLFLITLGNFDTKYDRLTFFFNPEDVLTHYGVSLNADKTSYELPF
ncbi:MAG: hypothetical protein AB1659_01615 [Thermodesulfobacteriota bacterium]